MAFGLPLSLQLSHSERNDRDMKMKRLRPLFWRKSVSVVLSLSLLLPAASSALADEIPAGTRSGKVQEVMDLLEKHHVSAPSRKKLEDAAVEAMIAALGDPYTDYFTPEELQQFTSSIENNYVGIGVRISEDPLGIYIEEVFDGSPAKTAGLQPGDIIVAVEGESVAGMKSTDVTSKIIGPEGTKVNVTVLRGEERSDKQMTRQAVHIPPVSSRMFSGGIGYIEVTTFSSDADEMMGEQLDALKNQGLNSLVVDLRDNPGGLLDTAQQMAAMFVEKGVLIHTRNRDNINNQVEISGGEKQPFPVYFLVNEMSASASEVLTGALQDYGVVTVIGQKTFGKGSVQNMHELSSGGALKITIEEYLTPKLRKVNQVGLEPDIKVEGSVPQLLEALRLAGMKSFDLTLRGQTLQVEGQLVSDWFDVVRQDGKLYVPARVLAALADVGVLWNEEKRAVELTSEDGSVSFVPEGQQVQLKDGTSYVDIAAFAAKFPGIAWTDDGRKATFRTAGE